MLVPNKNMLIKARKGNYAVGHFNTSNLEITQAIIQASAELRSPVMVAASASAIKYAGIKEFAAIVKTMADSVKIPVALHLDHGPTFELVKDCIKNGFSSVMIDGSSLDYKENIKISRKVANYAHARGVSVEAELGTLHGIEDDVVVEGESMLTDPSQAKEFVERTGIDSLAIAIGTSHGAYKFKGKSNLDLKRLQEIRKVVNIPLVLHGASSVYPELVKKANRYGAKLGNAHGVPDSELKKVIRLGISKINTDTDLRIAFDGAVREHLKKNPKDFDPRKIIGAGRDAIKQVIIRKIRVFGSAGKA